MTVCLAPVLLTQGLHVRRSTPLLPEPDGPRRGAAGNGKALRLLVLGDSAAAGVGVSTQQDALLGQLVARLSASHIVSWRLEAKTGATSASLLRHIERLEGEHFDVAILSIGVNDVTSNTSRGVYLANMQAILAQLKHRFAVSCIVVCGLPPMGRFPALPQPLRWYLGWQSRYFDTGLRALTAPVDGCHHYRQPTEGSLSMMASDGFHPGAPVYAQWAENIESLLGMP